MSGHIFKQLACIFLSIACCGCAFDPRTDWIPDIAIGDGWSIDAADIITFRQSRFSIRITPEWVINSGLSEEPLAIMINIYKIDNEPYTMYFNPGLAEVSYGNAIYKPVQITEGCTKRRKIIGATSLALGGASTQQSACILLRFDMNNLGNLSGAKFHIKRLYLDTGELLVPAIHFKKTTRIVAACGSQAATNAIFCMHGGR